MYVFKNSRNLILYSNIIEDFLQLFFQTFDKKQNVENFTIATNWLKIHNVFFRNYIVFIIDISTLKLFIFEISNFDEKKLFYKSNFIINANRFDFEIHNKNFRFDRFFENQNIIDNDC